MRATQRELSGALRVFLEELTEVAHSAKYSPVPGPLVLPALGAANAKRDDMPALAASDRDTRRTAHNRDGAAGAAAGRQMRQGGDFSSAVSRPI